MTKVYIIESEKGWGQRVDTIKEFSTREEAEMYCREYNSRHNPVGSTPDWYMYAHMEGQEQYSMLRLQPQTPIYN
jgi:hypothetical protein